MALLALRNMIKEMPEAEGLTMNGDTLSLGSQNDDDELEDRDLPMSPTGGMVRERSLISLRYAPTPPRVPAAPASFGC